MQTRLVVMERLTPASTLLLADAVLVLHVAVVAFVVGMTCAVLVGGPLRWRWVRFRWLRVAHVTLMVFIAAQAWLGRLCPLTVWEQALRAHAGVPAHDGSFVAYWLSRLIFVELPWWSFVAAYSVLAAIVLGCWHWFPPRRRR